MQSEMFIASVLTLAGIIFSWVMKSKAKGRKDAQDKAKTNDIENAHRITRATSKATARDMERGNDMPDDDIAKRLRQLREQTK